MTAERPSHEVLEAWIARGWDHRPPFRHDVFVEMWQEEQASRAKHAAEDWRSKEIVALRQRVAAIERILGPAGKTLIDGLAKATGTALRRIRAEDREHILGEVERRGYLNHKGVWDSGQTYPAGAVVTDHGSVWCAVIRCEAGERPSKAPGWRLMAKGTTDKQLGVA